MTDLLQKNTQKIIYSSINFRESKYQPVHCNKNFPEIYAAGINSPLVREVMYVYATNFIYFLLRPRVVTISLRLPLGFVLCCRFAQQQDIAWKCHLCCDTVSQTEKFDKG